MRYLFPSHPSSISFKAVCLSRQRIPSRKDEPINDPTETIRRQRLAEINAEPGSRKALEAQHGQVWNTEELSIDFKVIGFMAPFVGVRRRSDGVRGSVMFQASPRFYFGFQPE